ncbi:uncharacterized protein LOC135093957 [Scylla paramamosain]|uniref:uncharacterized protein LOC135093957 n=1 Tax=Scylla paramamosain TaxID=85552 RepID=UPI0030830674
MGDAAGEWTLVTHRKRRCSVPLPVPTASPEPDQEYVMSALQILVEQMSRLTRDVDDLKTREVGLWVPELQGYASHTFSCGDGSSQGMATYIRRGIPVTFREMGITEGIEFITVCLHSLGEVIYFVNMYIHAGALNVENFPDYVLEEQTVIMGDLNARHKELGSHLTTNANGVRWKAFLDTTDIVVLFGGHAPTHVQGGRLNYVALINMPTYTAETLLVRSLLSDHFALETIFPVQSGPAVPRKRLTVPCCPCDGSFADAEALYDGLLLTIRGFITTPRALARIHTPRRWTYTTNPVILNCQQMLTAYQRHWQLNPADTESRDAMVTVARHLTDLRQQERKKYWVSFLGQMRRTRSLQKVWHHVNSVRGKPRQQVCDPDPASRARELVVQRKEASSFSGFPVEHQEALDRQRPQRMELIRHSVSLPDDTSVPITHDELLSAVKLGHPGKDGIAYDILNALLEVTVDNPVLDLLNMYLTAGKLPHSWKTAITILAPKGDGTFRPISHSTCLCKMMEWVILNRLVYKVGHVLSGNVHGFLKGHSTSHCFVECLINKDATCRAFVDLKGACDRANKDVIMEELILKGVRGRLLGWIRDYLYNRTAQVWFQGAVSSEEVFELGTLQGGVLSPMLCNVLMDKIAHCSFPQGTQVLIYADDILLQCPTLRTQGYTQGISYVCSQTV